MNKVILLFSMFLVLAVGAFAQQPATLVNSASYTPSNVISPNSVGSLFGSGLSVNTVSAPSLPLPTTLDGVEVTISNIPAGLFFVSPYQINLHVPSSVSLGTNALVVKRNGVTTHTGSISVVQLVPSFFSQSTTSNNLNVNVGYVSDYVGGGYTNTNFWTYNAQGAPVIRPIPAFNSGHTYYAVLYLTGAANSNLNNKVFVMENIQSGQSVITPIEYSGSSFGSPGLDQVNVKLNNDTNTGYIVPSGTYRCFARWSNAGGPITYSTNNFYIQVP